jgi:hypothetical protein
MKVIAVKHIEDCFDGSYIHEILFDAQITRGFIEALRPVSQLQYYPTFARPFFKALFGGRFTLKGVEGNRSARILSFDRTIEQSLAELRPHLGAAESTMESKECERQAERTDAMRCHTVQ